MLVEGTTNSKGIEGVIIGIAIVIGWDVGVFEVALLVVLLVGRYTVYNLHTALYT